MQVQAVVTERAVEALNEGVLDRILHVHRRHWHLGGVKAAQA